MSLKCCLVGDSFVGKSSLLARLTSGTFLEDFIPTVFDTYSFSVLDRIFVYWDTAGLKDYNLLRPLSYPQTDIFLVCYSLGNDYSNSQTIASKDNIFIQWLPEVTHIPTAKIILLGLKSDLKADFFADSSDKTWAAAREWKKNQTEKDLTSLLTPPNDEICFFDRLPDEVVLIIFSFLHTPDLGRIAPTNRRFYQLCDDSSLWHNRIRENPGNPTISLDDPRLAEYRSRLFCDHTCSAKTGEGVAQIPYLILEALDIGGGKKGKNHKGKGTIRKVFDKVLGRN